VSSVERGHRNISLLNIYKLAGALGVEPAELLQRPPQVG
jgi:transcriptional regulator with XRE-family HTH domain